MNDSSDPKKVDIATFQKWSFRFAVAACVFVFPFLFSIFYSIATSISGLRDGSIAPVLIVGHLFSLLFLIAIPLGIYRAILKSWPMFQLRQQHPNEPWLWQTEWAEGKIPYTRKSNAISNWIIWFLFTSIGFGLAYGFADAVKEIGIMPHWLYGGAGIISIWILFGALTETRRWQKFGQSNCLLTKNPGVLGGWLRASIELPMVLAPGDTVQIRLRLLLRSSEQSSNKDRAAVWQIERTVTYDEIEVESNRVSRIPADIYIPLDVGVGLDGGSWGSHEWRLEANAKIAGLDYNADFKVPVFKTSDSSPEAPPEAIELFGDVVDTAKDFRAPDDIQITPFDGGVEIRQVYPKRPMKYIVILGLLFASSPIATYFEIDELASFFKSITNVIAPILLLAWLHELYSRSSVILTPTAVIRKSRIIFYKREKVIPVEDVREVWIESTQNPSGGESHRIDIKSKDSPPTIPDDAPPPDKVQVHWAINIRGITVAHNVENKSQARWLKLYIEKCLSDNNWVEPTKG